MFEQLTLLLFTFAGIHALPSVLFVRNVTLKPLNAYQLSTTIRFNMTCDQYLCDLYKSGNMSSYLAFNCFSNYTCQFFTIYPRTYSLPPSPGARLYFLQNRFPDPSTCCMPNTTELLDRLKNATQRIANFSFELAALGYDETEPDQMALIGRNGTSVHWFHPKTLASIENMSVGDSSMSVAVHNGLVYTALDGTPVLNIHHRLNGILIHSINHSLLGKVRKCIFMNNGTRMIVASQEPTQSLVVFDIHSPANYTSRVRGGDYCHFHVVSFLHFL